MIKIFKTFFVILLVLGFIYYFYKVPVDNLILNKFLSSASDTEVSKVVTGSEGIEVYAKDLEVPWEIAFLLITQRKGELLLIKNKEITKRFNIKESSQSGEGGLLGITIHPNFKENSFVYLYYTTVDGTKRVNKVVRYTLINNNLEQESIVLNDIRANIYHNAGKIEFGPDKLLYITAGDALDEPASQDKNQLAGKILRVKDNGEIPEDNPFNNEIYSLGHRNPQGLTWDKEGNLWSTEHGQSGAVSGLDELNKIIKGANYGWPDLRGNQSKDGFQSPIIHSGNETWAPGDAEFYNGKIFFTGLRGQSLYIYDTSSRELKKYLSGEYGRLRAITLGPDGYLYLSTSNRDGRGSPKDNDDKIIKINPEIFK